MPRARWAQSKRIVTGTIACAFLAPAAAIVWLGWRLDRQDRRLHQEESRQQLEIAADAAVASLHASLARAAQEPTPPAGLVKAWFRNGSVTPEPAEALLYRRYTPPLEPPAGVFEAGERLEFEGADLTGALASFRSRAASSDPRVRAAARFREARVLRKLNRPREATAVYRSLLAAGEVTWQLNPVPVAAQHAICSTLGQAGANAEAAREATLLRAMLDSGRYPLPRPTYLYFAGEAGLWLRTGARADPAREALSEALWILTEDLRPASGSRVIQAQGEAVTAVWRPEGEAIRIVLATSDYVRRHWLPRSRVRLSLRSSGGAVVAGVVSAGSEMQSLRAAADTGLPWTVAASGTPEVLDPSHSQRRRLLLFSLAAILLAIAAAAYFVLRSVRRELAVARLQSDFVAAVSHEFRTPLTALQQFTEMLRDQSDLSPGDRLVCYDAQQRATLRLRRLVESLLDFGRMEAGARPYRLEPCRTAAFVDSVIGEFRRESARAVAVEGESGTSVVRADPQALGVALWNLLDNAVKYSPCGGAIEVSVRTADGCVRIAVADRGVGIPAREREQVFSKFFRGAEARRLGIKGTGIGLAMVRHIVEGHGGSVSVQSVENQGSTFTIVLPAEE